LFVRFPTAGSGNRGVGTIFSASGLVQGLRSHLNSGFREEDIMSVENNNGTGPGGAIPDHLRGDVNPANAAEAAGHPGSNPDRVQAPGEYRNQPEELDPNRELPIRDYQNLTIPEIVGRIPSLSADELREIQDYEWAHRRRKTLLVRIERHLRNAAG
jgi:hypothetical protein